MRVLVLEHLTASAFLPPEMEVLVPEGLAMMAAVSRDLAEAARVSVFAAIRKCWIDRLPAGVEAVLVDLMDESRLIAASKTFDGVLLIAPEMNGIATNWARKLEGAGARLLGPPSAFIEWASDKLAMAKSLPDSSPITTPAERLLPIEGDIVVKPRDGVGASFTAVVDGAYAFDAVAAIRRSGFDGELIAQPKIAGLAASAAVVGRKNGPPIILPPAKQFLVETADDVVPTLRWLKYAGGSLPLKSAGHRVVALVESMRTCIDAFDGWFGIDVILADDGRDVVIDVNPRVTTSYLGYSRLLPGVTARLNLGLETSADVEAVRAQFDCGYRFSPTGVVNPVSSALHRE